MKNKNAKSSKSPTPMKQLSFIELSFKTLSFKALILSTIISSIGILSTYYLSFSVQEELTKQSYLKVESISKQVSIRFQDALDVSFNDLQALQAFYSANQHQLTQSDFYKYMDILDINNRHYIHALSWVPLIAHNERESFEASIRNQQSDFKIKARNNNGELNNSERADYYTPVTFISPYSANKAAQGFDLSSNSTRKKSLISARDSGKMTTTAKIRLVQEEGDSYGFLIIAPVYKKNARLADASDREQALLGYVTGVFRIDSLMRKAQEQADKEGFLLTLSDLDRENGGLLYGNSMESKQFIFDLTVPDREWQLSISIGEKLDEKINSPIITQWIMLGGIIISLLLAVTIYALKISILRSSHIKKLGVQLQQQNIKLESKVVQRTELLAHRNEELKVRVGELTDQRIIMSRLMKESEIAKVSAQLNSKELARSNKDLNDFAYIASHDLKTPLRGIMQLAAWIEEDVVDYASDETKSNLELLMNRTSRLEKLLEDLLDYSRVGQKAGDIQAIDTKEVILSIFDLQDPPQNISLKIQNPMPIIKTRKSPFETIMRNLIGNAIKHNKNKDDGIIEIRLKEHSDFYEFFVKDNGPGIPAKYHNKIFDIFKTLQPRDEVEGSGMGLSIIKKLLDHQGGSIYVKSDDSTGSTFIFTLPKQVSNKENT
jgi:signal transduction histidine kinase